MTEALNSSYFTPSFFYLSNVLALAVYLGYFIYIIFTNSRNLSRLVFVFPLILIMLYSIPMILFANDFRAEISSYWQYALTLNLVITILLIYGHFTNPTFLPVHGQVYSSNQLRYITNKYLKILLPLSIFLISIYFTQIASECTALYSLLLDPYYSLVAREFSGKIISTKLSSYAIGTYVNTVAPAVILTLLASFFSTWITPKSRLVVLIFNKLFIIFVFVLAIPCIFLTGAKGNIIPTGIFVTSAFFFLFDKTQLIKKVLVPTVCILATFSIIILFQVTPGSLRHLDLRYPMLECAIKYEKVLPLEKLARSLTLRENSLGISINDAKRLAHSLKYISKYKSIPGNYVLAKRLPSDSVNSIKLASASNSTFERMFVVPFRVSTWYYAYSGSEKYDVKLTLPFSKKIFGQSLNLPELVYQKYGSIYSQGDRTSTSTAPTSTLFTSSLNYSLPGLSIFVIFILLLDYIYCTVAKDSLFLLSFVGGFVWICAYNLAISDALTVLISHGLATSIILLFMLVLKLRRPQFLS